MPISFHQLLATIEEHQELRSQIDKLLIRKMAGDELDKGPAIPAIQTFLQSELTRLEGWQPIFIRDQFDLDQLDGLFRDMINKAWS